MRRLKNCFYLFLLTILLDGCIQKGYDNQYGKYVPKKPAFKLKDKPFDFPSELDTVNVYKMVYREYMGKPTFSLKDNIWESDPDMMKPVFYLKFYPKGRVTRFSKSTLISQNLVEKDLNPHLANQGYYFYDGRKIKIETFVYGQGYGMYLMFDYFLTDNGETLTMYYQNSKSIYIRERLPTDWKKYPVDW